ncbi:hypothetical protein LJC07_02815 [Christensenellaceae bacterium OttesenSCG-928-L17]|nr:hypothetical protein [Christensenellaceae bacterium OttesenSCG-928-L17]
MRGKRILALALCLAVTLTLLPAAALAAEGDITPQPGYGTVTVTTTSKSFNATVRLIADTTAANVTGVKKVGGSSSTTINDIAATDISTEGTAVVVSGRFEEDTGIDSMILRFTCSNGKSVDVQLIVIKNESTPVIDGNTGGNSDPVDPQNPAILVLASEDSNGHAIVAPSGNAGNSIQLRLPIYNRGKKSTERATDIRVTPVISASLDSFPFVIKEVDYSRKVPDMKPGSTQEVVYNFQLSKDVTSGVKEVKFNLVYFNREKQAYETTSFSVFVTVVKGATTALSGPDGEIIASMPKVIIESYSLVPEAPEEGDDGRIYAGEVFSLTMRVRNTASEAVKNIQVSLSNDGSVIIPANNGSNSLYIDRIGAGEVVERTVQLQSIPDADPKTQVLNAKFSYESSSTLLSYDVTESIAIPLLQRTRVRVDDPVMYNEMVTVDEAISLYLSLYNMGKSPLYNCMVNVEGEGLRMEETYFGGTISAGNQMRADFNVIASVPGDVDAVIVITFEDAYGSLTRIEKVIPMNVAEGFNMGEDPWIDGGEMPIDPGMEPEKSGMPTWLIVVLCVVGAGALVAVLVVIRRKRRKAELTEGV